MRSFFTFLFGCAVLVVVVLAGAAYLAEKHPTVARQMAHEAHLDAKAVAASAKGAAERWSQYRAKLADDQAKLAAAQIAAAEKKSACVETAGMAEAEKAAHEANCNVELAEADAKVKILAATVASAAVDLEHAREDRLTANKQNVDLQKKRISASRPQLNVSSVGFGSLGGVWNGPRVIERSRDDRRPEPQRQQVVVRQRTPPCSTYVGGTANRAGC